MNLDEARYQSTFCRYNVKIMHGSCDILQKAPDMIKGLTFKVNCNQTVKGVKLLLLMRSGWQQVVCGVDRPGPTYQE